MTRTTLKELESFVEEVNASLAEAGICSLPPRFTGNGSVVRLKTERSYGRTQVGVGNDSEWWWTLADGTPRHCIEVIQQWVEAEKARRGEEAAFFLHKKVKWLNDLFGLDSRRIRVDFSAGRLVVEDLDQGVLFEGQGDSETILATLNSWTAELRAYISKEDHRILICQSKPTPTKYWKTVPEKMGIEWHDDHSCNQVHLGQPWRWDYTLDPIEDPILFKDYLEDIIDLLV